MTRVAAMCLLDHWARAARLVGPALSTSTAHDDSTHYGEEPDSLLTVVLGRQRRLANLVDAPAIGRSPPPAERERVVAQFRTLVMVGEVDRAERLLQTWGMATDDLPCPDQTLLAWRRGRWDEALDQAWTSIAADVLVAHQADGVLYSAVAEILLSRGRPLRAKALLDSAVAERVTLSHVLEPTAASIEWTLGSTANAERIVAAALDRAARREVVHATDELWLLYTEFARARGDGETVRRGVAGTARVAHALGTDLSALHHLLALVAADPDMNTARRAVQLARAIGQPLTLALALERVVRWSGSCERLLPEAYELFGTLDALLHRYRIRARMRQHDIIVPDRAATVLESDRLLATLVADGLPNRQMAAALQTSEKSVESRLTRLFSRTGYRSRVELATATITGDYRRRNDDSGGHGLRGGQPSNRAN